MGFIEILLLFLCFCIVSAVINILEKLASAKLMKVQIKQSVDTVFSSLFRGVLKYKLELNNLKKAEEEENV